MVESVLTSTQVAILLELQRRQKPVQAEVIARKLGLSAGVIRYNIPAINHWLKARSARIVSRPKYGYKLEMDDSSRQLLLEELSRCHVQVVYSPEERRQLLLFELLRNADYQSLERLAERLSLSKSTLLRELSVAEAWLAERQLFLQKRPRRGTRVVGQEIVIRHTLVLLIMEVLSEVILFRLIQWGISDRLSGDLFLHPVQQQMLHVLQGWNLQDAMRLVTRLERMFSLRLSDSRFLYLVLYWAIAKERFKQGQIVALPPDYSEAALSDQECQAVRTIIASYRQEWGQDVPYAEAVVFLLEMFSSPPNEEEDGREREREGEIYDGQVSSLANRLVEQIARQAGYPIQNPALLSHLVKHISRMLFRFRYGLPVENPFADDVIRSYPEIWRATVEAVRSFGPELEGLSREEIAFLAMYFVLARQLESNPKPVRAPRIVVVCPAGGVSVWMLVSRLRTELPHLEIVANVSLRELARLDTSNVDAIITTAHNITAQDIPVICVSPFLNEEDILRIKSHLRLWGFNV